MPIVVGVVVGPIGVDFPRSAIVATTAPAAPATASVIHNHLWFRASLIGDDDPLSAVDLAVDLER